MDAAYVVFINMISEYTQLKKDGITIEANWNDAVKPAKVFKITIDGQERFLQREDLYSLMLLFGDEQQQSDLIPVRETRVREITRLLKVRAKKDIKKGDIIAVPYTHYIPVGIYDTFKFDTPPDASRLISLVNKQTVDNKSKKV